MSLTERSLSTLRRFRLAADARPSPRGELALRVRIVSPHLHSGFVAAHWIGAASTTREFSSSVLPVAVGDECF